MSRYIDAEKIEEVIRNKIPLKYLMTNSYSRAIFNGLKIAEFLNDNIPTSDVEEVVRCKDCKHYHQSTGFCDENSYFYDDESLSCSPAESPNWTMFSDYDFCSRGERRNGGD